MSLFDLAGLKENLKKITEQMEAGGFWDGHEQAQKVLKEKISLDTMLADNPA